MRIPREKAVDKRKEKSYMRCMWRIWYLKRRIENVLTEKKGVGVVEVILILVVLIGLVLIFKSQLTSLVQNIFKKIVSESSGI